MRGYLKNLNYNDVGRKRKCGSGDMTSTQSYHKMKAKLKNWDNSNSCIPNWGILYLTGNTQTMGFKKMHIAFKHKSKKKIRSNNKHICKNY
jgi:hypothetical protein